MYSYNPYYEEWIAHHGVKGQRWGIRRYQPYTSANKGVFKNLKRSYKSSVRSLKKSRKQFEKEGDRLAIDATNKALKDTKKAYKRELKGLKQEFKAENRANYLQDVAERGNEKQVAQVRKELSPDQLNYAVRRINAYKDWEKLSMRDVESEIRQEKAMARMDKIMKGADTVSKVATATINVTSAAKSIKDLFKKPSEYEKEKQRLELEQMRANIDRTKSQSQSMLSKGKDTAKTSDTSDTKKTGEYKEPSKESPKTESTKIEKNETKETKIINETVPSSALKTNITSYNMSKNWSGNRDFYNAFVTGEYTKSIKTVTPKASTSTTTSDVNKRLIDYKIKSADKAYTEKLAKEEKERQSKLSSSERLSAAIVKQALSEYKSESSKNNSISNSDAARYSRYNDAREIVNNPNKYSLSAVNNAQREVVNFLNWEKDKKKK